MANVFTNILQTLMAQSLMALREQAIITRLINNDFASTPQEIGDVVNVTLPAPGTVYNVAPSATPKTPTDHTPTKVPITLDQWKGTNLHLTDKEVGMITAGIVPSQLTENVRAIANTVNSYFYSLYKKVYGFAGTPGTIAFNAGTSADIREVRKVLNTQLAPLADRRIILDVEAESKALAVSDIVRYDGRGSGEVIRTGKISESFGFDWFMDQLVPRHVSTAFSAGAATANGVQAAGVGSNDNGRTGTLSIAKATNPTDLVAGDIITITGFDQTYVVLADVTLAVGNTSVSISPALQEATAGGEAIVLKASHTVNLAFAKDAFYFASRPLSSLEGSGDFRTIADPVTGLVLRGEIVRQNKQTMFELDVLYGGECVRPEFATRLAGQ